MEHLPKGYLDDSMKTTCKIDARVSKRIMTILSPTKPSTLRKISKRIETRSIQEACNAFIEECFEGINVISSIN